VKNARKGQAKMIKQALRLILVMVASLMAVSNIARADTLKYCNEADFPPFSYKTPAGNVEGFDIDVANYICKHMGVECELVVQEWTGIIPALNAGKCDVIISSMTINPDRRKAVLFSKPYYRSPYAFVAPKKLTFEINEQGLKGKTLCMFKNSTPLKWLDEKFKGVVEIKYYDGAEAIKTDLIAGRCDAWLETMPSIYGTLISKPEGKDYHFVGPQLTDPKWFGEGVGIAVRLGDEELNRKIDAAVDQMYADGTFKKINDKYFPFNLARE
jgi:arginine/ornithine transport system substrate-binding protein